MDAASRLDQSLLLAQSGSRSPVVAARGADAAARPAPDALGTAARDFEALLLQQFLRAADRPILEDAPLAASRTERLYRELFFEEVTARSVHSGGIGLARMLGGGDAARAPARGRQAGDPR